MMPSCFSLFCCCCLRSFVEVAACTAPGKCDTESRYIYYIQPKKKLLQSFYLPLIPSAALHRPIYCIIFAESKIISNYPFTGIKVTRTDLQAAQLFASLHFQCAGDWEIYVSYWQITDAFGNLQSVGNTSQQASRYIMYITLCNNTGHCQTCKRCFTMFVDVVQYSENNTDYVNTRHQRSYQI